jgi:peptidoglycan/LPS O-acetylase OafA/YrhL
LVPASVPDASVPPPRLDRPGALTAHRKPLPALTGIRFVAAFLVVLYHSHLAEVFAAHHLAPAAHLIENGFVAVLLFFLLSGFILSYTYQGQIETGRDLRRFYEARFARIWPLYALSLPLTNLFWHTMPAPAFAAADLLMVQSWNPWNEVMAGSWNFVCWTISVEAFFYVLFPWLQRWLERRPTRVVGLVLGAMSLLSMGLRTGTVVFNNNWLHWTHMPLALVRTPDFVIGVCLGNLFNRQRARASGTAARPLPMPPAVWTTLAALVLVALFCLPVGPLTALCVVPFAALLYGLAAERSPLQRLLSTRVLILGGQISYGVYLLQWPAKGAANLLCDRLGIPSPGIRFGVDVLLLLLIATAGFFWVEEPARKLLRAGFARLERRRPLELQQT